jgi:hypothetical protein
MECVPHRVVDAADVVGDRIIEVPHIRRRHRDELGEATIAVDADDPGVRTDVGVAGAAQQASPIDDVPLGGDSVSLLHVVHESPDLYDIAGELVSHHERWFASPLRPGVPLVDVNIGAAYTRASHPNENFVFTDCGLRAIFQFETGCRGFLDQRFH